MVYQNKFNQDRCHRRQFFFGPFSSERSQYTTPHHNTTHALHRAVPYLTTLHYIAPHRAVLRCTAPYLTVPHRTALYRTAMHRTVPYYTAPHCDAPHHAALHHAHCSAPYRTALHRTALRCTALHRAALHRTVLQCGLTLLMLLLFE